MSLEVLGIAVYSVGAFISFLFLVRIIAHNIDGSITPGIDDYLWGAFGALLASVVWPIVWYVGINRTLDKRKAEKELSASEQYKKQYQEQVKISQGYEKRMFQAEDHLERAKKVLEAHDLEIPAPPPPRRDEPSLVEYQDSRNYYDGH